MKIDDKNDLPENWAIHNVVLYNVIANIRNVAKLYIDDVILNAGDQTADLLLCLRRRCAPPIEWLSSSAVAAAAAVALIYLKRSLCEHILAGADSTARFVFVDDVVDAFVHRCTPWL